MFQLGFDRVADVLEHWPMSGRFWALFAVRPIWPISACYPVIVVRAQDRGATSEHFCGLAKRPRLSSRPPEPLRFLPGMTLRQLPRASQLNLPMFHRGRAKFSPQSNESANFGRDADRIRRVKVGPNRPDSQADVLEFHPKFGQCQSVIRN